MRLLLDTHVFLWWIADARQLSKVARECIGDGHNTLYWSAASSWEVTIKHALGRLKLSQPPDKFVPKELAKNRVESLPIIDAHALRAGLLPPHHKDPFDRMLVAQAQIEGMVLLTNDPTLSHYGIRIEW
jgi:PIN domain nuclease of toxin-antitoxin system